MLAGPNAGLLNRLWRGVTGADDAALNIFSMPGLIFVVTIYTFPYVYIMIANTLALIASDLEEAAAILGAGRLAVALTVTLPMVAARARERLHPGRAAGARAVRLARHPRPARRLPHHHHPDLGVLPVPAQDRDGGGRSRSRSCSPPRCCCSCRSGSSGRRGYAAVGGKGGQRRVIPLGRWRYPALARRASR